MSAFTLAGGRWNRLRFCRSMASRSQLRSEPRVCKRRVLLSRMEALHIFLEAFFLGMFFLGVLYKHREQQKGQGTKQQSQREGESETVTKGRSRKGAPLNEGEGAVRTVETGIEIRTSLQLSQRLSSGFESLRSFSAFLL